MKRILVGYIQDGKHSGIDKYLIEYCKVAYENGVHLDFLTDKKTEEISEFLMSLGYGLFEIPNLKKPIAQYKVIKGIIKNGKYDGVYLNISESFNCIGLLAAKSCKVPVRIVHSHSAGVDRENKYNRLFRTFLNNIFKVFVSKASTRRLACSTVAGEWMFNNNYEIIYNAIDGQRFNFNENARKKVREELKLGNKKVFIHIGNFCYQKNHFFLMDVMKEIINKDKDTVLLSIGVGYNFERVRDYAKKLGIIDNVHFLGVRSDIPDLLSASDVFIFPSRFEGLGIVCIEAQFSGLPCILSDRIPKEAIISSLVKYLPNSNPVRWAEFCLGSVTERKSGKLSQQSLNNYDISNQKVQLISILRR